MYILQVIEDFCSNLLPLLGVLALIALIIVLISLIKTLSKTNKFLSKTSGTVDLVDDSLKKAQVPLDSVVKVSESVDAAHDAVIKGINDTKDFVSKNADKIKNKLSSFTNNDETDDDEDLGPGPDDILKGE